jgi:hypothetical protein
VADDVGALDFQRVHQRDHVGGHAVDGVAAAARVALPDAAMVVGDDVELAGERRHLVAPKRRGAAEPGDEQDRKSAALALVIQRAVADRDTCH